VLGRLPGESAREGEHCSDAAAVIIGAGRSEDRIVMRADEKNLRTGATNFRLDIVTGTPLQIVTVAPRLQPTAGK
jgi:hypothetical protein